ncbi:hypothetical protein H0H93_011463 [Arthromyces matolae]|nr:hypothetical protein H0H93_011463 [Arthromyces matolae]
MVGFRNRDAAGRRAFNKLQTLYYNSQSIQTFTTTALYSNVEYLSSKKRERAKRAMSPEDLDNFRAKKRMSDARYRERHRSELAFNEFCRRFKKRDEGVLHKEVQDEGTDGLEGDDGEVVPEKEFIWHTEFLRTTWRADGSVRRSYSHASLQC